MKQTKSNAPYKWKCMDCNSKYYRLLDKTKNINTTILSLHQNHSIQYYTQKQYRTALEKDVTYTCDSCHKLQQNCKHSQRTYTKKQFVEKASIINKQGYGFTKLDYPDMSSSAFTTKINNLKGIVKLIDGTLPKSYVVIGYENFVDDSPVTCGDIGLSQEWAGFLQNVNIQYPAIHNIKIEFDSVKPHPLLSINHKINKHNRGINLEPYHLGDNIEANVTVYPKKTIVHIACSYHPIMYSGQGALFFIEKLTELRDMLIIDSQCMVDDIPNPLEWIITSYHFGKDGTLEFSGEMFKIAVKDLAMGFAQIYSKTKNGGCCIRIEDERHPHRTILQEKEKMNQVNRYLSTFETVTDMDRALAWQKQLKIRETLQIGKAFKKKKEECILPYIQF